MISFLFDLAIVLGIGLATVKSTMPKQGAMLVCLCVLLILLFLDEVTTGWTYYAWSIIVEFWAFGGMLIAARRLKTRGDRIFFRAMAGFFLVSCAITFSFYFRYTVAYMDYVIISRIVAVLHVLFMLAFSDGIRNMVGSLRNNLFVGRSRISNS